MQQSLFNKLIRFPDWARGRFRVAVLRLGGAHIGKGCFIRSIDVPCDPWDLWIGNGVGLDNHVVLGLNGPRRDGPKIIIRDGTYINRYTVLDAFERVEIGRNCLIGPHCYIGDHTRTRVQGVPLPASQMHGEPIILGDNVWLGAGVVVTKGVRIGNGATVGAGAVVTRDVPDGATVAGVPARELTRANSVTPQAA
jgi:acetyltransferase-like isoleucine patch superfamily enzyme